MNYHKTYELGVGFWGGGEVGESFNICWTRIMNKVMKKILIDLIFRKKPKAGIKNVGYKRYSRGNDFPPKISWFFLGQKVDEKYFCFHYQ